MKGVEFFAGSCTLSKLARSKGIEMFAVDNIGYDGVDLVADMENLTVEDLPFIPDFGWASPPCTTYSIAAISTHRDNGLPKTEFAHKSDKLILNTLSLFKKILKLNPNFVWYMENPRGYLRKMWFMKGIQRETIWYCQYGDDRAKPTDIWSNNFKSIMNPDGFEPRPECKNSNPDCHHQPAPRGARTGTQGLKNNHERSKLPLELCESILESCESGAYRIP